MHNFKFYIVTITFLLFGKIGYAQSHFFENKVWSSDCSKPFPSKAWIKSGKDLNLYLMVEPTRISKVKVSNFIGKEGVISFNYEKPDGNEVYVFEKNNASLKTRVVDGVVLAENGIFVKTGTPAPTLYSCEQNSVAASMLTKKIEEAGQSQASSSCLVLAESVEKYQIDTCNPEIIQKLITNRVNNDFVMTWQVVNGNEQVVSTVYGERGNQLGGNRVEKTVSPYRRTGKIITTKLTPTKSPDCEMAEEIVEETKNTLVLKTKSINGSTCIPIVLRITKEDIASGRKTRFVKINF